jgi:hypothetical protein
VPERAAWAPAERVFAPAERVFVPAEGVFVPAEIPFDAVIRRELALFGRGRGAGENPGGWRPGGVYFLPLDFSFSPTSCSCTFLGTWRYSRNSIVALARPCDMPRSDVV